MKVVIHGGMHKTGTTTLQHYLFRNRGLLRANGIYYHDDHMVSSFVLNAKTDDWTGAECARQLRLAREAGCDVLLLSTEVVSGLSSDQMMRMAACFDGCDLTFVFAFRHWASFWPSRWAQYCQRRDTQSFASYVAMMSSDTHHINRRFDLVIERASAVGKVKAISYDNAISAGGDILPVLLDALEVQPPAALPAARSNVRQPWQVTELCRLLNGGLADRLGVEQDEMVMSTGAHRHCSTSFFLLEPVKRLDPGLKRELFSAIESRAVTRRVSQRDVPADVEAALDGPLAHHFLNRVDGRAFASPACPEVRCTDCTWEDFAAAHPHLMAAAMDAVDDALSKRGGV